MDLLRHLRFFVAIAEEGHFGQAAERLGMTQPPVSQGLRKLETTLGVQLIRRTTRGAELTAAGRELLPRARLLVDDAERFTGEARRLRDSADLLRWGVPVHLSLALVARCAAALHGAPGPQRMVSGTPVALLDQVRSGSLDVAIVEHPCVSGDLKSGPVTTLPRRLIVPAGHRIVDARRPTLRMLDGLTLCHPPRSANPATFDLLVDNLLARGLDAPVTPILSDGEMIAAVASGEAFGLTDAPERFEGIAAVRCVQVNADDLALRLKVVRRDDTTKAAAAAIESELWRIARRTGRTQESV